MNPDRFLKTLERQGFTLPPALADTVLNGPITRLLTVGNPKTVKGEKRGYRTAGLHLFPSVGSGFNVCPSATTGCAAACLNTAGRGGFDPRHPAARRRRTWQFIARREEFMAQLWRDIAAHINSCKRNGYIPAVRLNVLSDIRWENIPAGGYSNLMDLFPNVQFYDYTKLPNRRNLPSNYHLTFSAAETNQTETENALNDGLNVAFVFRSAAILERATSERSAGILMRQMEFPPVYLDRPVIDGDKSDLRFKDKPAAGGIVALRAKGKAVYDETGFVRTLP